MTCGAQYYHGTLRLIEVDIPLKENGLAFESVYVDLHNFEQHAPWSCYQSQAGAVPSLRRDITHTRSSTTSDYLSPRRAAPPMTPSQIADALLESHHEHVMTSLDARLAPRVVVSARNIESGDFDAVASAFRFMTSRELEDGASGFSEAECNATRKIESRSTGGGAASPQRPGGGRDFPLADINSTALRDDGRRCSDMEIATPRRARDWPRRVTARRRQGST